MKILVKKLLPEGWKIRNLDSNKLLVKGYKCKKVLIVNREIELTETFFKAMGIYLAEGYKDKNRVFVGNSEIRIIQSFKQFLEEIGIPKRLITYRCILPKNVEIKEVSRILENFEIKNEKVQINFHKTAKKPLIIIGVNSKVLKRILDETFEIAKKEIGKYRENFINFLKGFLAGEASIKLRKNKPEAIRIYQKDKKLLEWINQLFVKFFNVKPFPIYQRKNGVNVLVIRGKKTLTNLKKLNVFELHKEKQLRFQKLHYKNLNQERYGVTKELILKVLEQSQRPLTIREIAEKIGKSYKTVFNHVKGKTPSLLEMGLVIWENFRVKLSPTLKRG